MLFARGNCLAVLGHQVFHGLLLRIACQVDVQLAQIRQVAGGEPFGRQFVGNDQYGDQAAHVAYLERLRNNLSGCGQLVAVDGDGAPFLAKGLRVVGRFIDRVVDQVLVGSKLDRLFACKLARGIELRQWYILHTLIGHAGVLVGADLFKREAAAVDKLLVRQVGRKPRVHLGRACHAHVPIGDKRLEVRLGGAAVRLQQAVNLVALGFGLLDCGCFRIFPAILVCRYRFHVGDVERHQARADGCVELGVLFQLVGEQRRQAKAVGKHDDAKE